MRSRLISKAKKSACRHRISCLAFDKKGRLLGVTVNSRRDNLPSKRGSGMHAEMEAIIRWGHRIKSLVIARVNKSGSLLPIHPCAKCTKIAKRLGIKISSVT